MPPMYECIVVQPESAQVLDAEGPLDGEWQLEYPQDPHRPHSDSWSMSVGPASGVSESPEPKSLVSEPEGWSPASPGTDDVSSPHTGPGSPMGQVENS